MKRLGYRDASAFTGINPGTLKSMVSRGQIPHLRISTRLVLFDVDDLQRWLESKRVGVVAR